MRNTENLAERPLMPKNPSPILLLLLLVATTVGCRRSKPTPWKQGLQQHELSESQFTKIMSVAIADTFPDCEVEVAGPLEISVTPESGSTTCYLDNVWQEVRVDPQRRVDIVTRHLEVLKSSIEMMTSQEGADVGDVVPVVKDSGWCEQTKQQGLDVYRQKLAADLWIVYAIDGANQLAFLSGEDIQSLGLSPKKLRKQAIENLETRLPKVTRHGDGPLYMMTAGGTFEASLLLMDDLWKEQDDAVDGPLVVAVPSRDLLLFTGQNATEAIQLMRAQVNDVFTRGTYLISRTLLVRHGMGWKPFDADSRDDGK